MALLLLVVVVVVVVAAAAAVVASRVGGLLAGCWRLVVGLAVRRVGVRRGWLEVVVEEEVTDLGSKAADVLKKNEIATRD